MDEPCQGTRTLIRAFSCGHGWRRAPHHEGLRPNPEEPALAGVSKDEAKCKLCQPRFAKKERG